MMENACDVIIPYYNEGTRPLDTVKLLLTVRNISKIIVVDDGSDNKDIYKELSATFPQVKIIRLAKNSGKANAVKEGLKFATTKYIFLFDADLSEIKPIEIERAIIKIIDSQEIDMIILPLVPKLMKKDWFRWYTILSGQRILRKEDLKKIYQNDFSGFQLEAVINDYMIKNNKKTYWMPSSLLNTSKYQKWGKIEGIKRVISLIKEFAKYTGYRNLIWQTLLFCREEAK